MTAALELGQLRGLDEIGGCTVIVRNAAVRVRLVRPTAPDGDEQEASRPAAGTRPGVSA